jgi:hypothetical protein
MRWLAVLLCAGLAGCGTGRTVGVRLDPALATLAPNDAVLMLGINMDALRKTQSYRNSLASRPMPVLEDFANETGLDARNDLWEALLVSNGAHTAILARGRFSDQGMEPKIQRPDFKRTQHKGYTLIGNGRSAFAFVNATTVVAGRPESVQFILDRRGESAGPPAALREIVASIPADSQIWLAATGGLPDMQNMARISSLAESVQAGADLRNGLNAFAAGTARSDQDAQTLADGVRGLLALARLTTHNQPGLLAVYDGIQVERQARTVRARLTLTPELFEKTLVTLFPR